RSGAYHGSEIPFVFDRMPEVRVTDDDARVERALHNCWVAFARTGKPACDDAADWPTFMPSGKWMVFDTRPSPRPLDNAAAFDVLQSRLVPDIPLAAGACPSN